MAITLTAIFCSLIYLYVESSNYVSELETNEIVKQN